MTMFFFQVQKIALETIVRLFMSYLGDKNQIIGCWYKNIDPGKTFAFARVVHVHMSS